MGKQRKRRARSNHSSDGSDTDEDPIDQEPFKRRYVTANLREQLRRVNSQLEDAKQKAEEEKKPLPLACLKLQSKSTNLHGQILERIASLDFYESRMSKRKVKVPTLPSPRERKSQGAKPGLDSKKKTKSRRVSSDRDPDFDPDDDPQTSTSTSSKLGKTDNSARGRSSTHTRKPVSGGGRGRKRKDYSPTPSPDREGTGHSTDMRADSEDEALDPASQPIKKQKRQYAFNHFFNVLKFQKKRFSDHEVVRRTKHFFGMGIWDVS
jgi:hypothetical protein